MYKQNITADENTILKLFSVAKKQRQVNRAQK